MKRLAAMKRRHHKESNVHATTLQSYRNEAGRTQIANMTGVAIVKANKQMATFQPLKEWGKRALR